MSLTEDSSTSVTMSSGSTVSTGSPDGGGNVSTSCVSFEGKTVDEGEMYYPYGHDACQVCRCFGGRPELCATVRCGRPTCRLGQAVKVKNRCCEWVCLEDHLAGANGAIDLSKINTGGNYITVNVNNYNNDVVGGRGGGGGVVHRGGGGGGTADIGLRMVASSVTAILSLCLLFFLIYRLRRRRLRRCRARAAALAAAAASEANGTSGAEGDGTSMDSSGVVPGGSSFELDRWWKPPEFHDVRTAPPSYDDAVMAYHAGEDRVDHVNNPDPGNHSIPRHQYGGGALDSADGYSTLSGGSSGGSSGSEAPAYSDIHGDPVIAYQDNTYSSLAFHPSGQNSSDPSTAVPCGQPPRLRAISGDQQQTRSVHLPRVLPAGPAPSTSHLHHVPDDQRPESRVSSHRGSTHVVEQHLSPADAVVPSMENTAEEEDTITTLTADV